MSWLYIVRHRAERATEEARTKIFSCDDADDVYGKGLRSTISIVSIGVGVVLPWFIPQERIGGVGSSAVALVILRAVISGLSRRLFGMPTGPAIILNHEGVRLWPGRHYEAWIPWKKRPREAGVQNGALLITTCRRSTIVFSISYLYPGCTQIGRVQEFYTRHRRLRHELAKPEGLERVRSLMQHPVREIEERLPPDSRARHTPQHRGRRKR